MKSYYAEQSPRGFGNEVNTYRFTTKAARDKWVAEHESDGDVNSASQGARAITADQARKNVAFRSRDLHKFGYGRLTTLGSTSC